RWNPHDSSSCSTLSVELDEQRRRIIVEIEKYSAHANTVRDLAAGMKAFVESETGKRDFDLMFLRSSRVAMLLAQIASTHAREDGWTLLSVADEQLSSLVPQQF